MAKAKKGPEAVSAAKQKKSTSAAQKRHSRNVRTDSSTIEKDGLLLVFSETEIYFVPAENVETKLAELRSLLLSSKFIPEDKATPITSLDLGSISAERIYKLLSATVSIRPFGR